MRVSAPNLASKVKIKAGANIRKLKAKMKGGIRQVVKVEKERKVVYRAIMPKYACTLYLSQLRGND